MLTHLKSLLRPVVSLDEQVLHPFVVNLEHGDGDLAFDALMGIGLEHLDALEDFFAGTRHDSLVFAITNNGVALSRSGLSVGKQACIVTFESVVEHFHSLNMWWLEKGGLK